MGIPGFFDLARAMGAMDEMDLPRDGHARGRALAKKCLEHDIKIIFVDVSSITGNVFIRTVRDYKPTDFRGFAHIQTLIDVRSAAELHSILLPIRQSLPNTQIILDFDHPQWRPQVKEEEAKKRENERLELVLAAVLDHAARIRAGGKKHQSRAQRHLERAGLAPPAGDGFATSAASWLVKNAILTTAPADADGLIARAARVVTSTPLRACLPSSGDTPPTPLVGLVAPPDQLSYLSSLSAFGSNILVIANDSDLAANTGSLAAQYFARVQPVKMKTLLGWIDKRVLECGLGIDGDGVGLANRAMAMGQDFVEGRGVHGLGPAKIVAAGAPTRDFLDTDWIGLEDVGIDIVEGEWALLRPSVEAAAKAIVPEDPWTPALRAFRGDDVELFDKFVLAESIWRELVVAHQAADTPPQTPSRSSAGADKAPVPPLKSRRPAQVASPSTSLTAKPTLHNLRPPPGTEFAVARRPRQRLEASATPRPALADKGTAINPPIPTPLVTGQARRRQAKAAAKRSTMVQVRPRGHVEPTWNQLSRLIPDPASVSATLSATSMLPSTPATAWTSLTASHTASSPAASTSTSTTPSSTAGSSSPANQKRRGPKAPTLADLRKEAKAKRKAEPQEEDQHDGGGPAAVQKEPKKLMALRKTIPIRSRDLNLRLSSTSPSVFRLLQLIHGIFNSFVPLLVLVLTNEIQTLRARHFPLSPAFLRFASDPAEASKAVVRAIKLMLDLATGEKGGNSAEASVWVLMADELGLAPASETQRSWEEEWRDVGAGVQGQLLKRSIPLGDYLAIQRTQDIFQLPTLLARFLRHPAALAILEDIVTKYSTSLFNIRRTRFGKFIKTLGEAFLTAPWAAATQLYSYAHQLRLSLVYLYGPPAELPELSVPGGHPALPPLLPIPSFPFIAAPDVSVLENLSAAAVSSPPLYNAITSLLPTILGHSTAHTPLAPTAVLAAISVLKPRLSQLCAAAEPPILLEDIAFLLVCLDRLLSHLLTLVALSEVAADELEADQPKTGRSSGTGSAWRDGRHSRLIGASSIEASGGYASSRWSGDERDQRAQARLEAVMDAASWRRKTGGGNGAQDVEEDEEQGGSRLAQVLPNAAGSIKRVASGGGAELVSGVSLLAALEQVVERLSVPPASPAALALTSNGATRASFLPIHVPASVADICGLIFLFVTQSDFRPADIARAAATAVDTTRPILLSQTNLDKSTALARRFDTASALLASHVTSPVDVGAGSDAWRTAQAMRALWGKSSSAAKIHQLASADQLEAFALVFGNARLGHLPHGALSFSPTRLHVKVLRVDLAPAHLVRTVLAAGPPDTLPQPSASNVPDTASSHPSQLPSLSVSDILRLAGKTEHVDKLYAGLSLPPARVPADADASSSSTWFDDNGDLLSTRIGRRRLTYPPFIPEPPIPSLPTLPLLHSKSPLLPTIRQRLGLNADGTGELAEGIVFLFIDLGLKNPVSMWFERSGSPSETRAILLRDAIFLESQRRDARDGRQRSSFDLKRRRDQLHAQAAQQLVAAAGLGPGHVEVSPPALSTTRASSSDSDSSSAPRASSSASASSSSASASSSSACVDSPSTAIDSSSTHAESGLTVVVAIGAGAIESSSGQRGPRAAGPVACKFVEQVSARDDLDFEWATGNLVGKPFQRIVICTLCGRIMNRDEAGAQNIGLNALSLLKSGTTTFTPAFRQRFGFPWRAHTKKAAGRKPGKGQAEKKVGRGEGGRDVEDDSRPMKRQRRV
ncbi:hypothetical protein NBRC10512v2_001660 [Rhodotorula toruloides]